MKLKKGQEEMVGFALIIVIVSVILLVFLSFALRKSNNVEIESYEVEGFLQSVLQTTSDCSDAQEFLSVKDLIFACNDNEDETCSNGENVCDVRDSILEELSEKSWNFEDALINGYELKIVADGEVSLIKEEGIVTKNYRGALQPFTKRGTDYEVSFKAYYS